MSTDPGSTRVSTGHRFFSFLTLFRMVILPLMQVVTTTGTAAADTVTNQSTPTQGQPATVPILVKFKASASAADIDAAIKGNGGQDVRALNQIRTHVINVPANAADSVVAAFARHAPVEHAAAAVKMTKQREEDALCPTSLQ